MIEHKKGNLYIASNPAFRHLLKLGITKKDDPNDRVEGLNSTGVPDYFHILYHEPCKSCKIAEDICQSALNNHRYNGKREFFEDINAKTLNEIMQNAIEIANIIEKLDEEKENFEVNSTKEIKEKQQNIQESNSSKKLEKSKELSVKKTEKSKLYYFNTNIKGASNRYEEMKKLGFISIWELETNDREKLNVGDIIALYNSGMGYIGIGKILSKSTLIDNIEINGKKLKDYELSYVETEGRNEYVNNVEWLKLVENEKAIKGFSSPMTLCLLKNIETINKLEKEFNIDLSFAKKKDI